MSRAAQGAVVVTGASSGIGEATARHLGSLGFRVFAGVRSDEDAERLAAATRVAALKIDVTDTDSVAAAAREVGGELAGLVNNAGIAVTGPIEFVPLEELRRQLEVNLVGQVAVTQAFMPALRAARGRIVNVSSIGGRFALPLFGPYAASKFALEGVSDSLRRELRDSGIRVSLVEPGGVATPIWSKGIEDANRLRERMPPHAEPLYEHLIEPIERNAIRTEREGLEPEAVARVIGRALTARRPRTRYLVGRDAQAIGRLARILPDRALDALVMRGVRAG